ncbi:MAG TPA: hypothetical protein VLA77_05060 [Candidatus Saccharimonadales bacterium]|nr:hypothetical protein [Candidatus Saccharimonadales bacterium]
MNGGWVKLYKKIFYKEELFTSGSTFPIFCLLLVMANENGEVKTSKRFLAKKLKMKATTVYDGLKKLEKATAIRLQTDQKPTIISICKWAEYQHKADQNPTANRPYIKEKKRKESLSKDKEIGQVSNETLTSVYRFYLDKFGTTEGLFKLTDKRKEMLRRRLTDAGENMVRMAIENTANASFYRGENDRNWKANLDFILRSYEQVERLSSLADSVEDVNAKEAFENADYWKR